MKLSIMGKGLSVSSLQKMILERKVEVQQWTQKQRNDTCWIQGIENKQWVNIYETGYKCV